MISMQDVLKDFTLNPVEKRTNMELLHLIHRPSTYKLIPRAEECQVGKSRKMSLIGSCIAKCQACITLFNDSQCLLIIKGKRIRGPV